MRVYKDGVGYIEVQEYLTRKGSKSYHIWDGSNTACKMWLAGGMNRRKKTWEVVTNIGTKEICTMCANVIGSNKV